MQDEQRNRAQVVIRSASAEDYDQFRQLFPELMVDDPVPGLSAWKSVICPSTWIATQDGEVVGYCYFQEYLETGYVRNIVVAKTARQRGVGRALMQATAECLRARGKRSWRLNVKPSNHAALALYERMGLRVKYLSHALRLPWAALTTLPAGNVEVLDLTANRDAALEELFDIPRGQLAGGRAMGRLLFEAVSGSEHRFGCSTPSGVPKRLDAARSGSMRLDAARNPVGLAVFDPKVGAFPFRVRDLSAVHGLLSVLRPHVPSDDYVNLVAEADPQLADLLFGLGATLRHEILHLDGSL